MNNIARCFDKAADTYDEHCKLQRIAGTKLIALTQRYHQASKRILDLGCGTGLITYDIAHIFRYHNFHAIDISIALLAKAKHKLSPLGIQVYKADMDALPTYTHSFDIIFANMVLHWSAALGSLFNKLRAFLSNDGILVFSIPLVGTFIELENKFKVRQFKSAENIKNYLLQNKFNLVFYEQQSYIFLFKNVFAALRSIKNVGANYAGKATAPGLRDKNFLKSCEVNQLTYVIGYFVAKLCQ